MKKAKQKLRGHPNLGYIEQATMESFRWRGDYGAIFMVWVAGYLDDDPLVAFLQKAKTRLLHEDGKMTRRSQPKSFIIILDNVLPADRLMVQVKGQRIRTQAMLETIF